MLRYSVQTLLLFMNFLTSYVVELSGSFYILYFVNAGTPTGQFVKDLIKAKVSRKGRQTSE